MSVAERVVPPYWVVLTGLEMVLNIIFIQIDVAPGPNLLVTITLDPTTPNNSSAILSVTLSGLTTVPALNGLTAGPITKISDLQFAFTIPNDVTTVIAHSAETGHATLQVMAPDEPPVWPDRLPQTPYMPDNGTPEYDPADNAIRTSVTVGPNKVRRRFTAVPEAVKLVMQLNGEQLGVLRDFVSSKLQDVMPFTWIDFRDGSQCLYRFPKGQGGLTYKFDSGDDPDPLMVNRDMWIVNLDLEKLP
jgi:hypothetical protein